MQTPVKDSKVMLAGEEWTVKYFPQVSNLNNNGLYCKAARVPCMKQIWLSMQDENGNPLSTEEITANFQKAILPMVIEDVKKKYGEDKVNEALKGLGIRI